MQLRLFYSLLEVTQYTMRGLAHVQISMLETRIRWQLWTNWRRGEGGSGGGGNCRQQKYGAVLHESRATAAQDLLTKHNRNA